MRRGLRHLFTLCSAVSGVLLVVVLAIWARSLFRVDGIIYQPPTDNAFHLYQVIWGRGRLIMGRMAAETHPTSPLVWYSYVPKGPGPVPPPDPDEFRFLGVRLLRRTEYIWHDSETTP